MMSRREFLKLLGAGGTIIALGGLGGFRSLLDDKKASPQFASAQTPPGGSWSLGQNTTVLAIHGALTSRAESFILQVLASALMARLVHINSVARSSYWC